MLDLQAILEAIDHLPPDEYEQVKRHVEQRVVSTHEPRKPTLEEQAA